MRSFLDWITPSLTNHPGGWHTPASLQEEIFSSFTILFVAMCLWIASGSLTTKQFSITKKSLWRSHTLGWGGITEICLYKKHGGRIEFRADPQKLVIDFRIMAFEQLLSEIEDRTHMQSSKSSSQKFILPSPDEPCLSECGPEPDLPNSHIPRIRTWVGERDAEKRRTAISTIWQTYIP